MCAPCEHRRCWGKMQSSNVDNRLVTGKIKKKGISYLRRLAKEYPMIAETTAIMTITTTMMMVSSVDMPPEVVDGGGLLTGTNTGWKA